jgi:hypothetical protein
MMAPQQSFAAGQQLGAVKEDWTQKNSRAGTPVLLRLEAAQAAED